MSIEAVVKIFSETLSQGENQGNKNAPFGTDGKEKLNNVATKAIEAQKEIELSKSSQLSSLCLAYSKAYMDCDANFFKQKIEELLGK